MTRESLEGKLRAIQELKAERYIGTQEAWEYIKAAERIYTNPQKVRNEIEAFLEERLGRKNIHYTATEERVVGTVGILNALFEKIEEKEEKFAGYSGIDFFSEYQEKVQNPFAKARGHMDWEEMVHEKSCLRLVNYGAYGFMTLEDNNMLKGISNKLKGIFYKAQYNSMDDKKFMKILLNVAEEDECIIFPEIAKTVISRVVEGMAELPLELHLSKESLKKQRDLARDYASSKMSFKDRVKRVKRDKVDHRLEIRREIILDCLIYYNYGSYEEALESIRRKIKRGHERREILKESKTPEKIIEFEQESIERNKYLLTCLASERNFIERILREGKKE